MDNNNDDNKYKTSSNNEYSDANSSNSKNSDNDKSGYIYKKKIINKSNKSLSKDSKKRNLTSIIKEMSTKNNTAMEPMNKIKLSEYNNSKNMSKTEKPIYVKNKFLNTNYCPSNTNYPFGYY